MGEPEAGIVSRNVFCLRIHKPKLLDPQLTADEPCPICRKKITLYKCFSCMKVSAFRLGSEPAKCPHCFTMVRSGAPLAPLPPLKMPAPAVAPTARAVKVTEYGIAIDNLSRSIIKMDAFAPFIEEGIKELERIPIGREFLKEFAPGTAPAKGTGPYANATVVIKPPTAEKRKMMQSIAETNKLTLFRPHPSPILGLCVGKGQETYLCVADLLPYEKDAVIADEFKKFAAQLQGAPKVGLIVPAHTEASSPSELLSNAVGEIRDSLTGSVLTHTMPNRGRFINLLQSFQPKTTLVRGPDLASGKSFPAQVTIFPPGSTWNNVAIDQKGVFDWFGERTTLRETIVHELIHCYHLLIGSPEFESDAEDEKRAVGLYQYKDYKYSENVFRAQWKTPLRRDYPRLKVVADPDLTGSSPKYDFLDPKRTVVDARTRV